MRRAAIATAQDQSGFVLALAAARTADVIIFVGGLDYGNEEEDTDRGSLVVPGVQGVLLTQLAALGIPIVTVLIHGGAISDQAVESASSAILHAGYPGQWAGTAIADVLFGAVNPSGRLPYTVYTNNSQLPDLGDYHMADAPGRTYAFLSQPPLYYFGDGLSYAGFVYYEPNITAQGDAITVQVGLANVGPMDGAEVVQVYAAYDEAFAGLPDSVAPASLSVPRRQLVEFTKVALASTTRTVVTITVPLSRLVAFGRWTQSRPAVEPVVCPARPRLPAPTAR